MPKIDAKLESYDNNYLITFSHVENGVVLGGVNFSMCDGDRNLLLSGRLTDIYEKDPRFLDDNFSYSESPIIFHDNDSNWGLSKNDTIVIRSQKNGIMVKSDTSFSLDLFGERFLKIALSNMIPVSNLPLDIYNVSNTFQLNESTLPAEEDLTISTEHIPFSSYKQSLYYYPVSIGVTLINNATTEAKNICLSFYVDSDVIKVFENLTVAGKSETRVVFAHIFEESGYRSVQITVNKPEWNKTMAASTKILIVGFGLN